MIESTAKERGILFAGSMVRAILRDVDPKTMTRRVVKPQPEVRDVAGTFSSLAFKRRSSSGFWLWPNAKADILRECPYGVPGDRLWAREAFMHEPADYCWEASVSIPCRPAHTVYRADVDGDSSGAGWSPSIHMPRKLSRITLEVTGVRVERLQDISEEDAIAEGIYKKTGRTPIGDVVETIDRGEMIYTHNGMARDEFAYVWDKINAARGFGWDANPWVWVVEFKRIEGGPSCPTS